jgi:hypothetical protein
LKVYFILYSAFLSACTLGQTEIERKEMPFEKYYFSRKEFDEANLEGDMVRSSLDRVWQRNDGGAGMITFIMNWFALTESFLGYPERSYKISNLSTTVLDPSNTAMCDYLSNEDGKSVGVNPYFQTGYDSFVLSAMSMMTQSYDSTIYIFPSMPKEITEAAFYDMAVDGGAKASGEWQNGKLKRA